MSFWRFCQERRYRLALLAIGGLFWFAVIPRLPAWVGALLTLGLFLSAAYQYGVSVGSARMLRRWIQSDEEFAEHMRRMIELAEGIREQARREQESAVH